MIAVSAKALPRPPANADAAPEGGGSGAASSSDAQPLIKSMKESKAEMELIRAKVPDNQSLVCSIASNFCTVRLMNGIEVYGEPLEVDTKKAITMFSTVQGTRQLQIGYACRKSIEVLIEVFRNFFSPRCSAGWSSVTSQ